MFFNKYDLMVNNELCICRFYNEEHITMRGYVIVSKLFFKKCSICLKA